MKQGNKGHFSRKENETFEYKLLIREVKCGDVPPLCQDVGKADVRGKLAVIKYRIVAEGSLSKTVETV